ncbi:MAG: serine/threonine protein kinase [Polyangiaceae bacterium]|nr:serine/threonine protein kinase [Polyangiaceae bacterium]
MTFNVEQRPGDKLGPYELVMPVAQGGMATVWAARLKGMRSFSKEVAIKAMLPSLGDDPQFAEMFLAEAKLACRVRHPNVVEVLDLGDHDGILYIVMEWVDGEALTLVQRAAGKRGGTPLAIACRIGMAAALGLHAAHETVDDQGKLLGLVHRDVSPHNILLTYNGQVKIVDFGVAKAAAQAAEGPQTRVGETKGTLPFMSPEQALGGKVDRRSDIFSLGVVLYYLLSGKHPFKGENELQTLGRITNRTPAEQLTSVLPACGPVLNETIMKALEKAPDKRFSTMIEFSSALERALAERPAEERRIDLGAFVRDMVGDRSTRRADAIREATSLLDQQKPVPKTLSNPRASFSSQSLIDIHSSRSQSGITSPSIVTDVPSAISHPAAEPPQSAPEEPPRNTLGIALIVGSVLVLIAVLVYVVMDRL